MTRIERMELLDVLRLEIYCDDGRYTYWRGRFLERRARRGPQVGPDYLFAAATLWRAQEHQRAVSARKPAGAEKITTDCARTLLGGAR